MGMFNLLFHVQVNDSVKMKIYVRNLIKTYLRLCFAVHDADQHGLMSLARKDNGTLHGDFWWVCVCFW